MSDEENEPEETQEEEEAPAPAREDTHEEHGESGPRKALPKMTPAKDKAPIFSAGRESKHAKEKLMAGEGIIPIQAGTNKFATQKGMTGFGSPRDVEHGESGPRKALPKMTPAKDKAPIFSAGRESKHAKEKLIAGEGIIPIQAGTNKFATQKGMTGFGSPRDVLDHIKCTNLKELEDESKIQLLKEAQRLQSGTNKFASQKGTVGFGCPRDVMYKPKGTGGASEVPEDKMRATDGIVILQSGTNKLASQSGMTGIGMPRLVYNKKGHVDQNPVSQGMVPLQMGTNKFASQAGMTGFGSPRLNVTSAKDEARGEIPFDESAVSRQTTGWKEGANQNGMSGFGAFRNTTVAGINAQERQSQGLIPYQMGINWADSMSGKTGFGMPRQIFTTFTDDGRPDISDDDSRAPVIPFWSGMERDYANQGGMTCYGMPRDVKGMYLRRLW